jgi:protein-L-isoaspartate(D-aspartate) O-methyltransferase
MIKQIVAYGVHDAAVLAAMRRVPRHEFVPETLRSAAYDDRPLPIGNGQTISQPFIVAYMTEQAHVKAGDKVLEIGTGCGYQAAVLAALGAHVYSIEIIAPLAAAAKQTLARLGIGHVEVREGNGYAGWPSAAPFEAILVTAAPEQVPPTLLDQLKVGGRLVVPVGPLAHQELRIYEKQSDGMHMHTAFAVRFVPMTGEPDPSQKTK